jgi:ribonuclease H / adenosylcobalamin/alpha-ribazole phosphatase
MVAESIERRSTEPPRWFPPTETATRVLLVRHGSTAHSPEGRFSGRNDLPLDAHGSGQARALARHVATLEPVDAVISSPLRRARETAQAIVETVGGRVEIHEDLVEAEFGEWEGLTITEAHLKWPDQLAAWLEATTVAPPNGESIVEVEARAQRAIDEIVAAHRHQRVAVISHVTPIRTLLCTALGAPPETMFRFHLDTASLSVVDYYDNGTSSVRTLNNAGHPSEPSKT